MSDDYVYLRKTAKEFYRVIVHKNIMPYYLNEVTHERDLFQIIDNFQIYRNNLYLIDELSLNFGAYYGGINRMTLHHIESMVHLYIYYCDKLSLGKNLMNWLAHRKIKKEELEKFDAVYDRSSLFSPVFFLKNYKDYVLNWMNYDSLTPRETLSYQIELTDMYMEILRQKIMADYLIRPMSYSDSCLKELDVFLDVYCPRLFMMNEVGLSDLDENCWYYSKVRNNMRFIDKLNRVGKGKFIQNVGHHGFYIKELKVCFITNGFHSISNADLYHKVKLSNVKTHSIEPLFDDYRFDGEHYRNNLNENCDDEVIANDYMQDRYWRNYSVDCLYELARNRYLLKKSLDKENEAEPQELTITN